MGELSTTVRKYGLSNIRPRHREMARRVVLGQTQIEIAKALGISQPRMSVIVNSPLFKIEIKRLEELRDAGVADIRQDLQEMAPGALETLERTMYQGKTEKIKVQCAESILDRAGHGKINKVEGLVQHNHSSMSHQELVDLVEQRVKRMSDASNQTQKAAEDAKDIEIEWVEAEIEETPEIELHPKVGPNSEQKEEIGFGQDL